MKFMTPMKSATNAEAGRRYTSTGVPICSITPRFITTIRSAIVRASSWSCVTMIVVTPTCRWSCRISCRRWTRTLASRADRGSSRSRRPGDVARARASATRCCWPPESCAGYLSPCSRIPTVSSSSFTRALDPRPGQARVLEPVGDVLRRREVREQGVGLEDDPEVALRGRQRRDVSAGLLDAPVRLGIQARDGAEERGLPAAGRSQEADELALVDVEGDPVEGGEVPESLRQLPDPEIGRTLRRGALGHRDAGDAVTEGSPARAGDGRRATAPARTGRDPATSSAPTSSRTASPTRRGSWRGWSPPTGSRSWPCAGACWSAGPRPAARCS